MWLIEGAFDGEPGNLEKKKFKLLKPGRSYPLGRKAKHPLQLVISHPKVSAEQVTFVVGECSVDNVIDPSFRPTLTIQNHKNKAMQVSRDSNGEKTRFVVQPLSEDVICNGDVIALVTGIYVNVHWRPICCYAPQKTPTISFDKCAFLGVKVVSTCRPEITHHLTSTLGATPAIATTLLTLAQLVRPDWLTELLHLGETAASADAPSTLELEFRLPAEAQHRPAFAPTLSASLKKLSRWEPSRERIGLFRGWRFVFVGEKGRELDTETRTLVERGCGEYDTLDIAGGATRWRQTLGRNKRKVETEGGKGMGVIGEIEMLKMAAGDSWDALQEELRSSGLRIIERAQLFDAVFCFDTTRIDSMLAAGPEQGSPLPDSVPNTHPEEPSLSSLPSENIAPPQKPEPASRLQLRKRATQASRGTTPDAEATPEPAHPAPAAVEVSPTPVPGSAPTRASEEPEGSRPRKKPLVKRARTNAAPPLILGVDDPSLTLSQTPGPELEPAAVAADAPPTGKPPSSSSVPTVRSSRLKKRARTDAPLNPILAGLEQEILEATTQQPSLKRFKALFDETDPDRVASQASGSGAFSGGIIDSQMFSQLPTESGGAGLRGDRSGAGLDVVPEEGKDDRPVEATRSGGVEDVLMSDAGADGPLSPRKNQRKSPSPTAVAPASMQRPVSFSSSQAPKRASTKGGAAPGKPDMDAAFLKALASTKKGKHQEDDFDREFNNLRISKPELETAEGDWRVLADFGDDNNLRGNFMVIVEMDVPGRDTSRAESREPVSAEWRGRPDFKKFKKKSNVTQHPSVALVADDENDYGMGPAYWKGSQNQFQLPAFTQSEPMSAQSHGYLQPSQATNRSFRQPEPGPSSAKPRSQSEAKASQAKTQKSAIRGKTRALQVVSEEEQGSEEEPCSAKNGKGKSQPLFLNALGEEEDENRDGGAGQTRLDGDNIDVDFDLDQDFDDVGALDDEPGEPTLRSTAGSSGAAAKSKSASGAAATKRGATAKKRSAALLDDGSDTGATFKGFRGRKKARAK